MNKANSAALLAQRLVERLESLREAKPADYMLSLQELINQVRGEADDKTVADALKQKEFKNRVLAAQGKDLNAPVALQEDLPKLAESPQLLDYLKSQTTPASGQPYLVGDLKKGIGGGGKASELKKVFEAAIRRKIDAGELAEVALKQRDPAELFAERMLAKLNELRAAKPNDYMPTLEALIQETGEQADDATVKKAVGKKPFKERVLLVNPKDPAAPIALQEDLQKLAESPQLLDYLKKRTPRSSSQPYLVADLAKAIPAGGKGKELRTAFTSAMQERIAAGSVSEVALKKPSEAEIVARLAENLVKVLESQRRLGPDSYPLSLRRLAEHTEADLAQESRIFKAAGASTFTSRAFVAWNKDLEALVAFLEDAEQVAERPELLTYAIRASQTKTKRAPSESELSKKLYGGQNKRLQNAFRTAVARQCEQDALPPGVAAVLDGQLRFFFVEDLLPTSVRQQVAQATAPRAASHAAAPSPSSQPQPRPAAQDESAGATSSGAESSTGAAPPAFEEFERRFEESFSRLDRAQGGHNFVSLAALRRELDRFERAEFDAYLQQLRKAQRFTLSEGQSKQGIPGDERAAGIVEGGNLLTYVSRRK